MRFHLPSYMLGVATGAERCRAGATAASARLEIADGVL